MRRQPTDLDANVGKRIRVRRLQLGLSQVQLSRVLGVSFQQLQKYESGANRLSAGRIYDLARHLGVTLDYFFEGVGMGTKKSVADEALVKIDKQAINLVRNFSQISDPATRAAVQNFVLKLGRAQAAQAGPTSD